VAQDRRITAGLPARVALTASRNRLAADGADLAIIAAQVVDKAGNPLPTANNRLHFTLTGNARLIGTGNGDPTDHDPDHTPDRLAFNGLAQALVQAGKGEGPIRLQVTGAGLAPASLMLFAHREV